ncbi:MAG: response regulator transcription factor [Caldilineaceae bacterium]
MRKNMARSLLLQGGALLGLGRLDQAVECLQQALALADRIEHGALRWQARLRLAGAYAHTGKPSRGLYQEAHVLTQEIAGKLPDPHLRSCFLAMPLVIELAAKATNASAKQARPRTKPHRPAGLSRRELEVLRLVAAGCTDRQIGEQLHITERTVNSHVANILGKTNCQNRAAASAFAVQHGLV